MKTFDDSIHLRPFNRLLKEPKMHAPAVARTSSDRLRVGGNGTPAWAWNILMDGLSKLLALRLPGAPPEDAIEGTALAWAEAIYYGRMLDEAKDAPRLRAGFTRLLCDVERWPAPRAFLDRVPWTETAIERHPPVSDEERAAGLAGIGMLRETMALAEWLRSHADRECSPIDAHLADVRLAMRNLYERWRMWHAPGGRP